MENARIFDILKKACETESGFLTILRMDHYDMFCEIYGEEMCNTLRDECIRVISQVTEEDDIRACLGGNEFVIFCKDLRSKQELTEMYFYITKRINESVEELTDNEESIHLGMSMGAVMVPDYGRDYESLFLKADVVLDFLREEGRHSIAFYDMIDDSDMAEKSSEDGKNGGAMKVDRKQFDTIKEFLGKYAETYKSSAGEMHIKINFSDEAMIMEDTDLLIDDCAEIIRNLLRKSDALYMEDNRISILLPEINSPQDMLKVAGRIERTLQGNGYGEMIELSMDSRLIGPDREISVCLEAVI